MANNGYEDDYDLDFYQNAISVRETLFANRSSSANESQAYQQTVADEEMEKSRDFYAKKGNSNMPLPDRLSYVDVDDPDNIQLRKFRPKNQYFAGVDPATQVKDLNSTLDSEPGYDDDPEANMFADLFDDLMQGTAERMAKGVLYQQAVERTGRGAVWKVYQMLHRMGLTVGEAAADILTPEELQMDEERSKAFWEAKEMEDIAELPESIQPKGQIEQMAQEMLAYLAPYSAVAKSIGMFNAIKNGQYVGAVARDAIASSILAQGYDPKEGTLSTVLRDLGYGEDILQYTDSKASYENDGRWAARLAMTMEEVGITAIPAAVAVTGMAGYKGIQRTVRKQNQQTLTELMDSMPKNIINSKGEPGNEQSARNLKTLARLYVDDGASFGDFVSENSGAHVSEVLKKAWDDASKDKELFNKAAATYLQGPRDMAAIHAMPEEYVLSALKNDGIPVPSIGIVKELDELADFGDWQFVLNHSAFSPEYDRVRNIVTREDMWSNVFGFKTDIREKLGYGPETLRNMTRRISSGGADPRGAVAFNEFNPHLMSSRVMGKAQSLDEIRARRGEYGTGTIFDADEEPLEITAQEMNDLIWNKLAGLHELPTIDPADVDATLLNITEALTDTRVKEVPRDLIRREMRDMNWPVDEINNDNVDAIKDIMDMSINIPIRYQEGKPQRALRFGPGQDVELAIAPEDADPEIIKALQDKGVKVLVDDNSGIAQIPESFKFAMPPVMAALMSEEEEVD